ncbi:hypothetical protein BAUCODRAFT_283706 [Baudoinia panamericana UAMH 10762]|uniref:Lytic polysaccharide monooxygenase n=1 Tax=Baudoinia panamericana (strain UAMH 10762) TaxID=717646 RepID=M2MLI4_BAUPA|nr:uncharacterized protein BAUCODRAFT_283706 [Baudoinia panamericana UAMH 10762]EMC92258.1 hypothetical protein BAUCODRAFT_283706 [Baudoinia panamericana UAMH 10762]
MFGITIIILATLCTAHMQLNFPPPFNASNNPHRTTRADPYLQYPYNCCGPHDRWMYPCRGYETLLGDPQGAATATWPAGSTQSWNISGIGNHYGGSCQVGFSTNHGETFRVATSYEGNCPHRNNGNGPDGQNFDFTVPADLPAGVHLFTWTWYNREQELNSNCAAVEITACIAADTPPAPVAFASRPEMFVADDVNGCVTPHTTAELRYPFPGPEVVTGDGAYPLQLPTGNCGGVGVQAYHGETGEDGH